MPLLDDVLDTVTQRTSGSNTLATEEERIRFSTSVRRDIASIIHQINTVYEPLFSSLPDDTGIDPLTAGLTGSSIYTDHAAAEGSPDIYWTSSLGRKRTIKESFDVVLSEIARIETALAPTSVGGELEVRSNGTTVGTQSAINFLPSTGVTWDIVDDEHGVEVDIGALLPSEPRPRLAGNNLIIYEQINCVAYSSGNYIPQVLKANLHYETRGETYDAFVIHHHANTHPNLEHIVALYEVDSTTHLPGALLWFHTTSGATTGTKIFLFSEGTWTTAGGAYKKENNQLVLKRGQAVYKAMGHSQDIVQFTNLGVESTRPLLGRPDFPIHGTQHVLQYTKGFTWPTLPDPFGTPTTSVDYLPVMGLRFVV